MRIGTSVEVQKETETQRQGKHYSCKGGTGLTVDLRERTVSLIDIYYNPAMGVNNKCVR